LYDFKRMVIKLTVIIIVGYHCYQIRTKLYPILKYIYLYIMEVYTTIIRCCVDCVIIYLVYDTQQDAYHKVCKCLSNILLPRLSLYVDEIIGDHQYGFRRNRLTLLIRYLHSADTTEKLGVH
jgi:ABC-type arginine transport system permease subunit